MISYKENEHPNNNTFFKINFLILLLLFVNSCFCQDSINPNGFTIFYFENGIISSEGFLKEGKPDGFWKTYYENGSLKSEGLRLNFLLDSIWVFYFKNGNAHQKITYKKNKKNGYLFSFNNKEVLLEKTLYKDNLKTGLSEIYHEIDSGKRSYKAEEKLFINNLEHGKAYQYDALGNIITLFEFNMGLLVSKEKINRYDKEGKKNGIWKTYYENRSLKWEGIYAHGLLNGTVKHFNLKGGIRLIENYDQGELKEKEQIDFFELERQINEDGTITVGIFLDNKKQGTFRKYNDKEELLLCEIYKNDIKLSSGIVDTSNFKQGKWIFYFPDGTTKAKGFYVDDMKINEWIYYYQSGKIQQRGFYEKGNPIGAWKWWYENEKIHRIESFNNGKEEGEIIEYDTIGNIITKGEFINGIKDGKWYYFINDYSEEGDFVDGEKNGIWITKYNNEILSFKGEYLNGIPINKHVYYYQNGKVKLIGKYNAGEKEGEWNKFNKEGEVVLSIKYKNGIEYKVDGLKIRPQHIND